MIVDGVPGIYRAVGGGGIKSVFAVALGVVIANGCWLLLAWVLTWVLR